jgi:Rieske Fe-S protein
MGHDDGRRRFLKLVGTGAVGLATIGLGGCGPQGGSNGASEITGPVAAGNVSELSPGGAKVLSDHPVVVLLDAGGVYAMTTICTHAGCDMRDNGNVDSSGLGCNCHGSSFDANGAVTRGPARQALKHYAVEIDSAGEMTVRGDQIVAASTRTPLPA